MGTASKPIKTPPGRHGYTFVHPMRRSIQFLMAGIYCGVLLTSAASVYLLHDVDRDQVGHLNAAFAGLCYEGIAFTLLIACGVGLLVALAVRVLQLRGYDASVRLSFVVGMTVAIVQYGCDLITRKFAPNFADTSLMLYIITAVLLSSVALVGDSVRQRKIGETEQV